MRNNGGIGENLYHQIDRANRRALAARTVKIVKKNKGLFRNPTKVTLEDVGNAYEEFDQMWYNKFNRMEKSKPLEVRTILPPQYRIKNVIESVEGDELAEHVFKLYVANKLAHLSADAAKKMIESIIAENDEEHNVSLARRNFENITTKIKDYFRESKKGNKRTAYAIREKLIQEGITETMLEQMENEGLLELLEFSRDAYYYKDEEIDKAVELLTSGHEDTSYGLVTLEQKDSSGNVLKKRNGQPKKENILVIDLKYFGQVSVHIFRPETISALSDTSYNHIPIYDQQTLMITDEASEKAKKIFDEKMTLTLEELLVIQQQNPRFAHYLAVKQGANREDIQALYNKNDAQSSEAQER